METTSSMTLLLSTPGVVKLAADGSDVASDLRALNSYLQTLATSKVDTELRTNMRDLGLIVNKAGRFASTCNSK